MLPGLTITVYEVIGLTPLFVGAVNTTRTALEPAVANTLVGEPGNPPVEGPGVVIVTQGTPVQFSNAAFFHLTLISSILKLDFFLPFHRPPTC